MSKYFKCTIFKMPFFFLQGHVSEKHEMKVSSVSLWELISHWEYKCLWNWECVLLSEVKREGFHIFLNSTSCFFVLAPCESVWASVFTCAAALDPPSLLVLRCSIWNRKECAIQMCPICRIRVDAIVFGAAFDKTSYFISYGPFLTWAIFSAV